MHLWDTVNELIKSWWPVCFTYKITIIKKKKYISNLVVFFYRPISELQMKVILMTLIPIYGYLLQYFSENFHSEFNWNSSTLLAGVKLNLKLIVCCLQFKNDIATSLKHSNDFFFIPHLDTKICFRSVMTQPLKSLWRKSCIRITGVHTHVRAWITWTEWLDVRAAGKWLTLVIFHTIFDVFSHDSFVMRR